MKTEKRGKTVCRYFRTPRGCFSGDKCQFLHLDGHAAGGVASQDGSLHGPLQSSSFHAGDVIVAPDSCHGSGGTYFVIAITSFKQS